MDSFYWIFICIAVVVIVVAAIVGVIGAFVRSKKHSLSVSNDRTWYLQLSLSKGDALSQWFLVLGALALSNAIYVINQNFGAPLSWQTILLFAGLIFVVCGYLSKSVYAMVIGIVGLLVWWVDQTIAWSFPGGQAFEAVTAIPVGLVWLAILLYVAGFIQAKFPPWKRFAAAYTFIGILMATTVLFIFSTRSGLEALESMIERSYLFDVWQNLVSIFVIGVATTLMAIYAWADKRVSAKEVAACAVLFLLFGVFLVLPDQNIFFNSNYELSATGIFWAAIINFALFFEILGVIFSGYLRKELWLVNMGTIFLLIFVAVKYFDWFFDFMDKSVFFLVAGVLLFGVGWTMERGRRYLVKSINS